MGIGCALDGRDAGATIFVRLFVCVAPKLTAAGPELPASDRRNPQRFGGSTARGGSCWSSQTDGTGARVIEFGSCAAAAAVAVRPAARWERGAGTLLALHTDGSPLLTRSAPAKLHAWRALQGFISAGRD